MSILLVLWTFVQDTRPPSRMSNKCNLPNQTSEVQIFATVRRRSATAPLVTPETTKSEKRGRRVRDCFICYARFLPQELSVRSSFFFQAQRTHLCRYCISLWLQLKASQRELIIEKVDLWADIKVSLMCAAEERERGTRSLHTFASNVYVRHAVKERSLVKFVGGPAP